MTENMRIDLGCNFFPSPSFSSVDNQGYMQIFTRTSWHCIRVTAEVGDHFNLMSDLANFQLNPLRYRLHRIMHSAGSLF